MKSRSYLLYAALALLVVVILGSCATLHDARPLDKGQQRVTVSLGGPLFSNLGFPMPVPLLGVNWLYGLTDRVTVGATAYVTDALFGTGHIEANAIWAPLLQSGAIPEIALHTNIHVVTDFKDGVQFFPEVGITPSWQLGPVLLYGGVTGMIDLYPSKAFDLPIDYRIIPAFYLGATLSIKHLQLTAELKYLNPFQNNVPPIVNYIGIGTAGALAPFIGVSYSFGGGK